MRTTLDIDAAVLVAARHLAQERGISLGAAVSELARRALQGRGIAMNDGLPAFIVDQSDDLITPDMVRAANETW